MKVTGSKRVYSIMDQKGVSTLAVAIPTTNQMDTDQAEATWWGNWDTRLPSLFKVEF